jgi:hypothetical protein
MTSPGGSCGSGVALVGLKPGPDNVKNANAPVNRLILPRQTIFLVFEQYIVDAENRSGSLFSILYVWRITATGKDDVF